MDLKEIISLEIQMMQGLKPRKLDFKVEEHKLTKNTKTTLDNNNKRVGYDCTAYKRAVHQWYLQIRNHV